MIMEFSITCTKDKTKKTSCRVGNAQLAWKINPEKTISATTAAEPNQLNFKEQILRILTTLARLKLASTNKQSTRESK